MNALVHFLLDLFSAQTAGELARARVGSREVTLSVDANEPLAWLNGTSFQPLVTLRVDGRVVSEQEVAVQGVDVDWFEQPAPDTRWLAEARAQLAAWRERMSARLRQIPEAKLDDTMPFDVSFMPSPLELALYTLEHGPPTPRPTAGSLGDHAAQTAATLRALPAACAFSVGAR